MNLPFADDTFDFVFTRYLLVHLPHPVRAIREMLRVTKPGSTVFAQEPDLGFQCSYPPSPSYDRITSLYAVLFPEAQIGRRLVHLFREAGASIPQARAEIGIECDGTKIKTIYRMSFAAIREALVNGGHLNDAEFSELLDDFIRVEKDPSIFVMTNPIVTVWTEA